MPEQTFGSLPHHYWWASIAVMALNFLRPLVKLSGQQSDAWQTVTDFLQTL